MNTRNPISRRSFLSASAAAIAIPCVAHARVSAGISGAIRLGVIGCGARGMELMRRMASDPGKAAVVAVCDASETRAARARTETGAEVVGRWQDLVERRDVDAVVVAAPDHQHAPMSIAAMQCGKDVYCEKPMTLRLEEAKAFRDTATQTRRVVQIGVEQTSQAQWRLARELVGSGAIGTPVWCQGNYPPSAQDRNTAYGPDSCPKDVDWEAFCGSGTKGSVDPDRFVNWRKYWDYSNGVVGEDFYHKLTALLVATGAACPERVSAAGGVYAEDGREVPDSFVMTAEYSGGLTIVLASSMANRNGVPAIIRGSDASIELRGDSVRVVDDAHRPVREIEADDILLAPGNHVSNWFDCIRSRGRCVCNEEIGYQAMVATSMAVESYRRGKTLRFNAASA